MSVITPATPMEEGKIENEYVNLIQNIGSITKE